MKREHLSNLKYALIGMIILTVFGRLALYGTGYENNWYRYLVPMTIGLASGFLIGNIKKKWANQTDDLRENVDLHKYLIENSSTGYWQVDKNEKTVRINDRLCKMLGYDRDELMKLSPIDLIVDKEKHILIDQIKESKQTQFRNYDLTFYKKNGEKLYAHVDATTLLNSEGESIGAFAFISDITKHILYEEELQESEDKFKTVFKTNPDSITLTRVSDGKYIEVNDGFLNLTGYSEEDIEGKSTLDVDLWNDPKDREKMVNLLKINGFVQNFETSFRIKDGTVVSALMSAKPIKVKEELYIVTVARDISEIKEASENLKIALREVKENEERFRDLANLLPLTLVETDLKGFVTYANKQAFNTFGISENTDITKLNLFQFLSPEDVNIAKSNIKNLVAGKSIPVDDLHALRSNKSKFIINIYSDVIKKEGKIVGLRSVITDITKRKELEEKLIQSQKMEAVGRLAGGIAHDFNNLLTVMSGYAELLQLSQDKDDESGRLIKEIQDANERAAALTKQLLLFSRKQVGEFALFDLNIIIRDFEKILRRLIGEDITLLLELTEKLPNINVDKSQIEQIIMNLAVNARDAMPSGGQIKISTSLYLSKQSEHNNNKNYIEFTFSDNGTGIDFEIQKKIFDPFFTTKKEGEGTGLGLATVYGIVKQCDGFMEVDSHPNEGTIFKMYFPCSDSEMEMITILDQEKIEAEYATETILLVEDDESVRKLTYMILQRSGYEVLEAVNGKDALEVLEKTDKHIDLLLTDIVMPEMSGSILRDKFLELRPGTPVLFVSGYTEDILLKHGIESGSIQLVHKPFKRLDLLNKIRDLLSKKSSE